VGAILCLVYGVRVVGSLKNVRPESLVEVKFTLQEGLIDPHQGMLMESQRLMQALSFLTKVTPPPPVIKEPVVIKAPAVTSNAASPPPPPPPFDPKMTLVLVSYDDVDGRHLAFLNKVNDPAHPYLLGESLPSDPKTILKEIHRDHVVLVAEDGRKKMLYTKNADIEVLSRPNSEPPTATAVRIMPSGETVSSVPKTRRVPRSRNVEINKEYGVAVVEYDPTPDGEKRYAISENDLKALQNQALRLMSEVSMQPAYDNSGQPKGIQLDFIADEPLAKSYGIQNGDILTHVDGKQVTSTYEAEGIYNNLGSDKRRVQMSIERQGTPFNVWFEMDDFPGTPNK